MSEDTEGLVGHLKNSTLCNELDGKPLEGFGQRSDMIKLLCSRDHFATWSGTDCVRARAEAGRPVRRLCNNVGSWSGEVIIS